MKPMQVPDLRKHRSHFTEKLKQLLAALDACSEREFEFDARFSFEHHREMRIARSRVKRAWLYGSYARGATLCNDLDILIELETTRLSEDRGLPENRQCVHAFWPAVRNVQINVGTPSANDSNVSLEGHGLILVWEPGMDWRSVVASIPEDELAGRFPRLTDALPFNRSRVGLGIEEAQELSRAFQDGVLSWNCYQLPDTELSAHALGGQEEIVQMHFARRGKEAAQLVGRVLAGLRELAPEINLAGGWRWAAGDEPRWKGFELQLGSAKMSVKWLKTHPKLRGFIIAPYIRSKGPNGIWVIQRGPKFETGMDAYLEAVKRMRRGS